MHRTYDDILLGRRRRVVECAGGVRLIEAAYAPGTRFEPHAHDRGNVSLILRGQIEETVGRDVVCATTCGVVVKPAGTVHSNRFGPDGARTLVIEVPSSLHPRTCWRWFHGGPVTRSALRVYRAIEGDDASDVHGFLSELIATIEEQLHPRRTPTAPPWVLHVRDALHDAFPRTISVSHLATAIGVHPVYLTRAFRARFGCAVTEYVQRLRIRAAAHRLACSSQPLCGVACATGFADQSHLTRVFKRDTGVTPGQFRRLARGSQV
jgi:AraC family transcriptional regulator